jgi:hypothetical protein
MSLYGIAWERKEKGNCEKTDKDKETQYCGQVELRSAPHPRQEEGFNRSSPYHPTHADPPFPPPPQQLAVSHR